MTPVRARPATRTFARRYVEWWVNDLPPLHGLLRFVFYGGLLLFALDRPLSPLSGIGRYERTSPELFRPYGLLELLGISYVEPAILHVVITATTVAWICAAIGLFTRVSAVVTALGAALLHGMFFGSNTLNHNWFLPVYALIALCFARTSDPWSVDYQVRRWWKGTPPAAGRTLADTGFARKVVLVLAVGYYFGAGMSKLLVAGPRWADGHTIAYFAAQQDGLHPLSRLLADNLWLCAALAVASLALELGAPAALFSRRARYALILGWACMHVGIRLSIGPRYAENILCFVLLVDWGAAGRAVRARAGLARRADHPERPAPIALPDSERRWVPGVVAATSLIPLVLAVAIFRVFWWPLTNVYMYCSYFSLPRQIRADHPLADYHDAAAAQRIARGYLESRATLEAVEHFVNLVELRLAGGESEAFYLRNAPGVPTWKQWILTVVRPVLIEDFAAKPLGRVDFDPDRSNLPAQQFLLQYLEVFRKRASPDLLKRYQRLELTYPIGQGQVAIASVRLDRSPSPRTVVSDPP